MTASKLCRFFLLALCASLSAPAQTSAQSGNESRIHSDFRREWLELHPCREQEVKPCNPFSFGHLAGTAQTIVTGQPLHLTAPLPEDMARTLEALRTHRAR